MEPDRIIPPPTIPTSPPPPANRVATETPAAPEPGAEEETGETQENESIRTPMRIDPIEIFGNALTSIPLRLLAVWITAALGAFLPVFLNSGIKAFQLLGWQFAFIPFYLFAVAFSSGFWLLLTVPLLAGLFFKSMQFAIGDNGGADLMVILTLSYFIGLPVLHLDHWSPVTIVRTIAAALIGAALVHATVRAVRRDRQLNPY